MGNKCKEPGCPKYASFNFPDEKKRLYCEEHAHKMMVNVRNPLCIDCGKRARFNFPEEKGGKFCKDCKLSGMVDVVCKTCEQEGCPNYPTYNFPGEKKRLYCFEHFHSGMIYMASRCKNDCGKTSNKYDGYCLFCFVHIFPDVKISVNYKIKERHVTDFIKEKYTGFTFDKTVNNGCSKRRPDAYIDVGTHVIIVEIDENSHKSYDSMCENKRMMELFQDFGGSSRKPRAVVFIRFNPDAYTDASNKHASCFKLCRKSGVSIVRDKKIWNKRLDLLKETIDKHINTIPEKEVTNEYLFYDSI